MTEIDEMLACLINLKESNHEKCKLEMSEIAHDAYNFIHDNYKINFMVSVSSVHKSIFGIPEAYQEAMDAIEYGITMEKEKIISYDDIKVLSGDYCYTIETEHQLINCIKAGDFEGSRYILNEVFDRNFSKATLSNDLAKCLMFDLISTMLKTKPEISFICDDMFLKEINIVGRLLKCEGIQEMKQQMTDILGKICVYIQKKKKNKKEQLILDITKYIKDNYSDMNLSVAGIADKFDLTSPYLAKMFKENKGEGLYDYINRIRLEEAMMLLKDQESSIKDIAAKVGYCNSNVFIRAFKKHTGVTPGNFKSLDCCKIS